MTREISAIHIMAAPTDRRGGGVWRMCSDIGKSSTGRQWCGKLPHDLLGPVVTDSTQGASSSRMLGRIFMTIRVRLRASTCLAPIFQGLWLTGQLSQMSSTGRFGKARRTKLNAQQRAHCNGSVAERGRKQARRSNRSCNVICASFERTCAITVGFERSSCSINSAGVRRLRSLVSPMPKA
jgi:hypothetical protein